MNNDKVYALRDKRTRKIVSDLTNKHRKYYVRKQPCLDILGHWLTKYKYGDNLEMVTFKLVEEKENEKTR